MNEYIKDITLMAVLTAAVATDVRSRRIPNALTVAAFAVAIIMNGMVAGGDGIWMGLKGGAAGAAVMLLPFMMGGMGGGDVKLMAVVGAFKGAAFVFAAFVCAAVAGGIIAMISVLIKGNAGRTFKSIKQKLVSAANGSMECADENEKGAIPYACAIFAGTAVAYFAAPFILPG